MYKVQTTEDQQKFIVPLNRDTENIFYDQRFILDGKVITEPRVWSVTKLNRLNPNGICLVTLAQSEFDEHKDYIELDDNGNVIGAWADYYASAITPTEPEPLPTTDYAAITYSGTKPEIKSGGSYKKFTVTFFDADGQELSYRNGTWSYEIDGEDATTLLSILDNTTSTDVNENQIKVKFNRDDTYIGKVLNIKFTSDDGILAEIPIEIIGL